MRKGSKTVCKSASHQRFKDKAKNRVDDLQGMFNDLQFARKESRSGDVAILEEQVNQMLREWKSELNEASPASSLIGASHVSSDLSSDIRRLLQLCEEEDDATSKLVESPQINPKPDPDEQESGLGLRDGESNSYQEVYYARQEIPEQRLQDLDATKPNISSGLHPGDVNCVDYQQFSVHQDQPHDMILQYDTAGQHISDMLPAICPPASAFLRPKCALWDCPRPAKGSDWFQDYCSCFHAILALNEGPPGMNPVLRPGGIDLKDGPLFAALIAKTQGKNVGIPECEGAATTKSPWNAPELFDLAILEGESLREWLFFDKPRRAFESGNRKQRSLPDYSGRGWHESRKQVMKEFGGLKRSYYMDPQPLANFEWHLYEYEINNCDASALYRLELKLVDSKKSTKGKVSSDSLSNLQQQIGMLHAELPPMDNGNNSNNIKRLSKGRAKGSQNRRQGGGVSGMEDAFVYGPSLPFGYTEKGMNSFGHQDHS